MNYKQNQFSTKLLTSTYCKSGNSYLDQQTSNKENRKTDYNIKVSRYL